MTFLWTLHLCIGLALNGDAPKGHDKPVEAERAKLQGRWQQVSSRVDGADLPAEIIRENYVTFSGNKKIVHFGDQLIGDNVRIKLDPSTTPKTYEEGPGDSPEKGMMNRGIYKVEGDTLTQCFAPADRERPTEFLSRPGSGHVLQVFRRIKGEDKPRP